MGAAYPELVQAQSMIEETLLQEETRFRTTLDRGLRLLEDEVTSLAPGGRSAGCDSL
jgi:alanyl-tRNA synthetase